MPEVTRKEWDDFYHSHADASFLQSGSWGELKSGFGWEPVYYLQDDGGFLMLIRKGPLGVRLAYIPKGPLGEISSSLILEAVSLAKARHCFVLTIEPDRWQEEPQIDFGGVQTRPGKNIQPRRTIIVPLNGSEESWLERMKQKTRYNIRLAEKKEVRIQSSNDVSAFHSLMEKTGIRDGFGIHSLAYYQKAYEVFSRRDECTILMASFESRILGGLFVIAHGQRAWYVYGASSDDERNRMPTYLLQWEAMKWAAQKGCESYDLWGIPDEDEDVLESQFEKRSDGLWGVYRFKRGFGGQVRRSAQAVDIVIDPFLYSLYLKIPGRTQG